MEFIFFYTFSFLVAIILFNIYIKFCFKKNIFVTTDEFSNDIPKKKKINSGGLIFFLLFYLSLLLYNEFLFKFDLPNKFEFFLISLFLLSLISFLDDIKPINPIIRLAFQLLCAYVSLVSLNLNLVPFPLKVSILGAVIIWIYLINITNFMDGSDGFCGINIIFFILNALLINYAFELNLFSVTIISFLLPIILAFLIFNMPPSKLYMGDTGSIFCGFLIGFTFLELSINGYFVYAFIGYIYVIIDATITLFIKCSKGYMPWARHSDYFFLKVKKMKSFEILDKNFLNMRIFILNSINLTAVYLSIILNNYLLMIFPCIFTMYVIFKFQNLYKKKL